MKKFAIFSVLVTVLLITSCKKPCYECSINVSGVNFQYDICDGKVCLGTASCTGLPSGTTEKEYAEQLESQGYTCNKK